MRGPGRLAFALIAIVGSGCDPIPAGRPFTPVSVQRAAPAAAPAVSEAPAGPQGGFDFEAEDRDEDGGGDGVDALAMQALLMGIDPGQIPAPAPAPAPTPVPVPTAPTAAPAGAIPVPIWAADQPLEGSWGLRLLATLHDVQPPRAIVAMADGKELVVQPGQMLPEYRVVVLAVGRDAVQFARITPQGFYAKVETETVASMAPGDGR